MNEWKETKNNKKSSPIVGKQDSHLRLIELSSNLQLAFLERSKEYI